MIQCTDTRIFEETKNGKESLSNAKIMQRDFEAQLGSIKQGGKEVINLTDKKEN